MTCGKKTLFSLLLGFDLLASMLELTHVNFLYTTTLISFCTCILLPGFLISLILRISKVSFWENLLFIVGLSIAFLEFGGLLLNIILPLLGIKDPLAFQNLVYGFNIFLFLLFVFAWIRTKQLEVKIQLPKHSSLEKVLYSLPVFFPVLATLGAIVLNNGGSDILTLILLGAIAVYTLLLVLFRDKIGVDLYPYALFFIGLASLFTTSLRSWYITGHDIEKEFYVFQLTNTHHIWNMALYQDPFNACLSITILPTILTNLLSIQDMYVYKVIFQILFAISPILVFFIIRNYTTPVFAFLSAFFYMSFPVFFNDMAMLNRQEIGFIFFGLVLYMMLLSELSFSVRKILFIIFAFSAAVSHYSTNFVLLGLITFVYALTLIISIPFVTNTFVSVLVKSHITLKNAFPNKMSSGQKGNDTVTWYANEDTVLLPTITRTDPSPKTPYQKMLSLPQLPQTGPSPKTPYQKMLSLPQLPQTGPSPKTPYQKMLSLPQLPQIDPSPKIDNDQKRNDKATWYANEDTILLPQITQADHFPKTHYHKMFLGRTPSSRDQLRKSHRNEFKVSGHYRLVWLHLFLSLPLLLLLLLMTYSWNNLYTNSSNHVGSVISEVVSSLLVGSNADNTSNDVSYSTLFAPRLDPKQQLQAYIDSILQKVSTSELYSKSITSKYPSYPIPQEQLAPTPLGNLLSSFHIPVFNIQAALTSRSIFFMHIIILIGLLAFFFFKNEKPFDLQYLLLCFSAIFLLALIFVMPVLSVEYGEQRMLQQLLFVLSLPIVFIFRSVLFFVKEQKRIVFTGIIAILFFLNSTGFISHLTGDYYPQMTLDNAGLYYDAYYVHKSDVLAIVWLSKSNVNHEPVETDREHTFKLLTYGDIQASNVFFPAAIQKNAYVYLASSDRVVDFYEANTLIYNSPKPFLDDNKDLVYSNGKGNVYK